MWRSSFWNIILDIYNMKFHAISSIVESSCRFDSKFTVCVRALPCHPAETNERSVLVKKDGNYISEVRRAPLAFVYV